MSSYEIGTGGPEKKTPIQFYISKWEEFEVGVRGDTKRRIHPKNFGGLTGQFSIPLDTGCMKFAITSYTLCMLYIIRIIINL